MTWPGSIYPYLWLASSALLFGLASGLHAGWRALDQTRLKLLAERSFSARFGLRLRQSGPELGETSTLLMRLFAFLGLALWAWLAAPHGGGIGVALVGGLFFWCLDICFRFWATTKPDGFLGFVGLPTGLLMAFAKPFAKLLLMVPGLRRMVEVSEGLSPVSASEEEIRKLIRVGKQSGSLEKDEAQLLEGIFKFGDRIVSDVMIPRDRLVGADIKTSIEDVLDKFSTSGFSRLPVYKSDLDHIVGVVYAKDCLTLLSNRELLVLDDLLRPATKVSENIKISDLLHEFQRNRIHFAIVIDEYGGTLGLVTLEDMIEEIVGEIEDEYDAEEEKTIVPGRGGTLRVLGRARVEDLEEIMGIKMPERPGVETVGGYLVDHLGEVPTAGLKVSIGSSIWKVEKVSPRKVLVLIISKVP